MMADAAWWALSPGALGLGALAVAAALDAAWGEPRNAWHPVAWFGRALAPLGPVLCRLRPGLAWLAGGLAWLAAVGAVAAAGWVVQAWLMSQPLWLALPLLGLALKPSLAWRMLHDEVAAVARALGPQGDVAAGRQQVARLCSRDVATLDAAGVRETAIETLAENLNDSLVAPLFWFVLAGLPGAWAWRAANTLDAMWGYRGRWEWAGKWAARADDLLAWLPARLAGLLLLAGSGVGLGVWRHQARRTPSPNGGWPMAAMALHLGIRLGKPGVYVLNGRQPPPGPADLPRSLALARRAARTSWLLAGLALLLVAWARGGVR